MIRQRLMELPNEIAQLKLEILQMQERAADIKEQLQLWELAQIDDIANAQDEKGKPVYSNEAKRKAELEKRKQGDSKYQGQAEELKELEHEIQVKNIYLEKLYNEQSNLRSICRLEGSE
mgnify:CR=1 FL=1